MDTSLVNISKSNRMSEDHVCLDHTNNYSIIIQADGNGTVGSISNLININDKTYSEVALTTSNICDRLLKDLIDYINNKNDSITLSEAFSHTLRRQIFNILGCTWYRVAFCVLISIIDKRNNTLHTYSVGDCSLSIYDIISNRLIVKNPDPIQEIRAIYDVYRIVPSSILDAHIPTIHYWKFTLPTKYVLITYSDGLDSDIRIPVDVITERNIIKQKQQFSELSKNPKYWVSNISKSTLKNIIIDNYKKGANAITNSIVDNITPLKRIDDVSMCVLIKK